MEDKPISLKGGIHPVNMTTQTIYSIWVFVYKGERIERALHFNYRDTEAEANQLCAMALENIAGAMEVTLGYLPSTA